MPSLIYIIPTYINVCRDIFKGVLGGEHNVFKINSENDVDLQDILNDFINCFCKGYVEIKTKYKLLPIFKINFHKNNLPHLLGLHYTHKKVSAKKIIGRIAEGKITHESIKTL